jgi:hypothetical protein
MGEIDYMAAIRAGRLPAGRKNSRREIEAAERRRAKAEAKAAAGRSRPRQPGLFDAPEATRTRPPARSWAADASPTATWCGRAFLASECERCRDIEDSWGTREYTRDGARARLGFLVNTAINRKAGEPDARCRKQETAYLTKVRRDCEGVRDAVNHRRRAWGLNGRRWETDEIQARYGHLLGDD